MLGLFSNYFDLLVSSSMKLVARVVLQWNRKSRSEKSQLLLMQHIRFLNLVSHVSRVFLGSLSCAQEDLIDWF